MKDLFEETKQLVNYQPSTKVDVHLSMYHAIQDLSDKVNEHSENNYNLLDLLFVISEFKRVIDKLSIVGLLSDSKWEVLREMLRTLDARCRHLMDKNDEMEEGE